MQLLLRQVHLGPEPSGAVEKLTRHEHVYAGADGGAGGADDLGGAVPAMEVIDDHLGGNFIVIGGESFPAAFFDHVEDLMIQSDAWSPRPCGRRGGRLPRCGKRVYRKTDPWLKTGPRGQTYEQVEAELTDLASLDIGNPGLRDS